MKSHPAIFLDRDGVLNYEKGYITEIEQLELFAYAKECIEKIHKCGFLAIVISNQSAVGRELMSEEKLCSINNYIKEQLQLDAVYYCPHWYKKKGRISQYNKRCECRKPKTGLIEQAVQDFQIERQASFFVGDRDTDIQTGKNSRITTVLLKSGYENWDVALSLKPDYVYTNLLEFVSNLNENINCTKIKGEKL